MKIEHYQATKLKKEILEIIGKYLHLNQYRIFVFGSRVHGGGSERSDIDVGIEGSNEVPHEIMAQIKEDIENLPTLYKIEIVDFQKVSPGFKEVAFRHTEAIIP